MALTQALPVAEPADMTPAASARPAPAPAAPTAADAQRLSRAVARGDEEAFRELYDVYSARILRLAVVLVRGNATVAQEVAQAVWLLAARKLKPLESEPHLWNWLALVTRQQAAKALRHYPAASGTVDLAELHNHPAPVEPDTILEECLHAAVQSLVAEDRRVIESFYFEHSSCEQIAAELGTTSKAVSSRLERARARLRAIVQKKLAHEA
jgi:RNA polymerase sigma-70 factor, ECF subfamily